MDLPSQQLPALTAATSRTFVAAQHHAPRCRFRLLDNSGVALTRVLASPEARIYRRRLEVVRFARLICRGVLTEGLRTAHFCRLQKLGRGAGLMRQPRLRATAGRSCPAVPMPASLRQRTPSRSLYLLGVEIRPSVAGIGPVVPPGGHGSRLAQPVTRARRGSAAGRARSQRGTTPSVHKPRRTSDIGSVATQTSTG